MTTASVLDDRTPFRVATIQAHVTLFDIFDRMGVSVTPETQQMRCPFHADRLPSARVYADQNKLYCFSCQKSWDVIAAVQDHWRLGFHDALTWVEREFGLAGIDPPVEAKVRAAFFRTAPVDLRGAAATVEATLGSRRGALGYRRYTELLHALDLTLYELSAKRILPAEARERLRLVVQAALPRPGSA
jgi:hypothetical protein